MIGQWQFTKESKNDYSELKFKKSKSGHVAFNAIFRPETGKEMVYNVDSVFSAVFLSQKINYTIQKYTKIIN